MESHLFPAEPRPLQTSEQITEKNKHDTTLVENVSSCQTMLVRVRN